MRARVLPSTKDDGAAFVYACTVRRRIAEKQYTTTKGGKKEKLAQVKCGPPPTSRVQTVIIYAEAAVYEKTTPTDDGKTLRPCGFSPLPPVDVTC